MTKLGSLWLKCLTLGSRTNKPRAGYRRRQIPRCGRNQTHNIGTYLSAGRMRFASTWMKLYVFTQTTVCARKKKRNTDHPVTPPEKRGYVSYSSMIMIDRIPRKQQCMYLMPIFTKSIPMTFLLRHQFTFHTQWGCFQSPSHATDRHVVIVSGNGLIAGDRHTFLPSLKQSQPETGTMRISR